jgi:hypothetical protein
MSGRTETYEGKRNSSPKLKFCFDMYHVRKVNTIKSLKIEMRRRENK